MEDGLRTSLEVGEERAVLVKVLLAKGAKNAAGVKALLSSRFEAVLDACESMVTETFLAAVFTRAQEECAPGKRRREPDASPLTQPHARQPRQPPPPQLPSPPSRPLQPAPPPAPAKVKLSATTSPPLPALLDPLLTGDGSMIRARKSWSLVEGGLHLRCAPARHARCPTAPCLCPHARVCACVLCHGGARSNGLEHNRRDLYLHFVRRKVSVEYFLDKARHGPIVGAWGADGAEELQQLIDMAEAVRANPHVAPFEW